MENNSASGKFNHLPNPLVSWFEIPALNHERAKKFYSELFQLELSTEVMGDFIMSFFPGENEVLGAIISGDGCTPSQVGPLIYLNAGNDMEAMVQRIASAGGMVVLPKTLINEENGYFAIFIDSEGNRIALHAAK